MDNAVALHASRCKVTVGVGAAENGAWLEVADSGQESPLRIVKRVFDRHRRGNRHLGTTGSGLGLSIVKRVAVMRHPWRDGDRLNGGGSG